MADKKNKKSSEDSLEDSSTIIQPNGPAKPATSELQVQEETSLTDSGNNVDTQEEKPRKHGFSSRVLSFTNIYFIIFLLILFAGGAGIFAAIKFNNDSTGTKTNQAESLTDEQLADLKNNTTLVGDAQQTLDIQGNSIFEGQVLMRNNLDVAGSIKVGGSLSLPAITVGGSSNFGQIHVNEQLSVSGNTILQGQLTVQKGLTVTGSSSFGALSASQINATSLQLSGDFTVNRHINVSGGTPSRTGGTALGSGGTATVSGTDTAGTVTINTGGGPPAGCFVTMNFTQRFNTTPRVVISPSNSSAGTLSYYTNRSNTAFSICTVSGPASSTTYVFDYIIFD